MKYRGFTLIEILLVVGIFGLVLSIVALALNSKSAETRDMKRVNDIQTIRHAMGLVKNESGTFERSFCPIGAVSDCAKAEGSDLAKFIIDLGKMKDPSLAQACKSVKQCEKQGCNYTFSQIEQDEYEILFHLEKGVSEFNEKGCYRATPLGIFKIQ
jgi:prepilin-type N-terminal cleavage/methylation domain-containing protein